MFVVSHVLGVPCSSIILIVEKIENTLHIIKAQFITSTSVGSSTESVNLHGFIITILTLN